MRKVLVALGVVVLIALSIGAVLLLQSTDEEASTSQNQTDEIAVSDETFSALSTKGQPFIATVTTKQDGEVNEATIAYDGDKTTEYTAASNGQEVRTIYTEKTYYTCNPDQGCFKFDLKNSTGTNFDPEEYQYSDGELEDFENTASYEGQKSCDTGTCDVWMSSNFDGRGKTTIYLDAESKRVVKVEGEVGDVTSTIAYEYKDVKISIPKNAQELPSGI